MIEIVPYNPQWPEWFHSLGQSIRGVLQNDALAIHHIGSTSVPGLAAKNIIDIQVTVAQQSDAIIPLLEGVGFTYLARINKDHRPPGRDDIPEEELTKMIFSMQGTPRCNLHVRVLGYFNQRYPLLCRDYLRQHPYTASAYAQIKQQLAKHFPEDIYAYYDIKDPVFDLIMEAAYTWAEQTNWQPPATDI